MDFHSLKVVMELGCRFRVMVALGFHERVVSFHGVDSCVNLLGVSFADCN